MFGGRRRLVALALNLMVVAGCAASSGQRSAVRSVPPAVAPARASTSSTALAKALLAAEGKSGAAVDSGAAAGAPVKVFPTAGDLGPVAGPAATGSRPGRLHVLLVGDGVMYDAAPGLEAAFASTGRAEVTDGSRWGMGLTQDGGWGWPDQWSAMVAGLHPDVVLVLLGKWDVGPTQVGSELLQPGSAEWAAWYRTQVDHALSILSASGSAVVWLGMAPENVPGSLPATDALNTVLRQATEAWPAASFVDTTPVLGGPDGQYAETLQTSTGTLTLRKSDGVHLCPDGVVRLADAAVAGVEAEPALVPAAGWDRGPWRGDVRYSWAPGGGCPAS